ncbi:MAG: alpha/beta hydrolase [Dehalococcoidia bacterium]
MGHSWDLVSLHLSDRFHVYALDQRGHGDSEWSRDGDYSTDSMAEDAIAFLLHEEIEQPIIFGHSMGGMVTMTLLKRAPTLAQAVVLVDIGPEVSADGTATIRRFIESASEFDDLDEFVARVQAYDPFRTREHIERTVRYNMIQRADGKYVSKNDRARGYAPQEQGAVSARRITLGDVRTFPCLSSWCVENSRTCSKRRRQSASCRPSQGVSW